MASVFLHSFRCLIPVMAAAYMATAYPSPTAAQIGRSDGSSQDSRHGRDDSVRGDRGRGIGMGIGLGIGIIQGLGARTSSPTTDKNTSFQGTGTARKTGTRTTKHGKKDDKVPAQGKQQTTDKQKNPNPPPTVTTNDGAPPPGTTTDGKPPGTTTEAKPPGTTTSPTPPNTTTNAVVPPDSSGNNASAAPDPCPPVAAIKRREPWGNVTFENCCGPVCPNGPSNQQIADMLYDGCDRAKKALTLINQILPTGRAGLESTLTKAGGPVRLNIDDLNGTTYDSWNAVHLHDILVDLKNRCEKDVTIKCETCKKGVPGNIYTYGAVLLRKFSDIHVCVNVEQSTSNWCTDKASEQASSLLHEMTHLVGIDHDDKPFTTYRIADQVNALIPTLATAYDKLNAPPATPTQVGGQASAAGQASGANSPPAVAQPDGTQGSSQAPGPSAGQGQPGGAAGEGK